MGVLPRFISLEQAVLHQDDLEFDKLDSSGEGVLSTIMFKLLFCFCTLLLWKIISDWSVRGTPWAPNSPDLTPCDFFLHGFVKVSHNIVFSINVTPCCSAKAVLSASPGALWSIWYCASFRDKEIPKS